MRKNLVPTTQIASSGHSRNAFMHFLNNYRKTQRCCRMPAWVTACEAGYAWSKMPLIDKYYYIEAARNAGYRYKARDRRMNRVLEHLRKALESDEKCNLVQLASAVKQMQLWKRRVLHSMIGNDKQKKKNS